MTTTDYIINAVLILLVLRQLRERRLDLQSLILPVALVAFAAHHYLHAIPTSGNDLALIAVLAIIGVAFGFLCGYFTKLRTGSDGVALARARWLAACFWVAGIGSRMGFAFASDHGARTAIAHFSLTNHITGGAAWTTAFVLMALCEVTARLVTIHLRADRLTHVSREAVATAAA